MKIVFASKNEGKLKEIKAILAETGIDLVSLNSYPNVPKIVEDGNSFRENALKKAGIISEFTGENVLADDSGLTVDILNGEPGIYSSRYAGPDASDEENNAKLLENIKSVPVDKRMASFNCVLVFYQKYGEISFFEGKWQGQIIDERRGTKGFGYDPIFWVPELKMTAAELPAEVKNKVSHRAQAFSELKRDLLNILDNRKNGA
jgi:XTP/dITP diphosphohydrolase